MPSAQPTTVARSPAQLTEGIIAALAALISVYAMRRADPDMWGYLTYGRLFLEQGRVTSWDVFAYTAAGHRWVDHAVRSADPDVAGLPIWRCHRPDCAQGGAGRRVPLRSLRWVARSRATGRDMAAVVPVYIRHSVAVFHVPTAAVHFRVLRGVRDNSSSLSADWAGRTVATAGDHAGLGQYTRRIPRRVRRHWVSALAEGERERSLQDRSTPAPCFAGRRRSGELLWLVWR